MSSFVVGYFLEGSGHVYGISFRTSVQSLMSGLQRGRGGVGEGIHALTSSRPGFKYRLWNLLTVQHGESHLTSGTHYLVY